MDSKINQSSHPNFKANLIVAPKAQIIEEAGEECAKQLEVALPELEKIAQDAKEIDAIYIRPVYRGYDDYNKNAPVSGALTITVAKAYENTRSLTVYEEDFASKKNGSASFAQYLIEKTNFLVDSYINYNNLRKQQKSGFSFLDWFKQLFN